MNRPKHIDIKKKEIRTQVELFGKLCATQQEMADWFDCSLRTIEREMSTRVDEDGHDKVDENGDALVSEFCRVYKKAQAESKTSLRRVQMNKALTQEDTTLLIWLGKQLLGQRDKHETENTNETVVRVLSSEPLTVKEWEEAHNK